MGDLCKREICDNISIYPPSSDEHVENYLKNADKKNKWQIGKIISKIYNLTSYNYDDDTSLSMSPCYGLKSTNDNIFAHLGPVLGLHYGKSSNSTNTSGYSLIVVNPNSLQRFKDENKLLQHKAIHPIAITTVSFGSIGGIGKCIFCATQCGKLFIYLSESFEQILLVNTSQYYHQDTAEITTLSLISPVGEYVEYVAAGNIFGHVFLYQVPNMALITVLFKSIDGFNCYTPKEADSENYTPKVLESLYNEEFVSQNEPTCDDFFLNTLNESFFTSTMNVTSKNSLWVAYGDSILAVLSTPEFTISHISSLIIDDKKYIATNIQFSRIHKIALILLGYDYLMVRDIRSFNCLRLIPSNVLTCGFPISSFLLSDTYNYLQSSRNCILIVAGVDGSICLRKLERKEGSQFAWTLIKRFVSEKDDSDYTDAQVPILCMHLDEHSDSFFGGDARGLVRRYSNFLKFYHNHHTHKFDLKVSNSDYDSSTSVQCNDLASNDANESTSCS